MLRIYCVVVLAGLITGILSFHAAAAPDPLAAANACSNLLELDNDAQFQRCWARQMMTPAQAHIIECYHEFGRERLGAVSLCASGIRLTEDQRRIANCMRGARGNFQEFALCTGGAMLSPEQQRIAGCAATNWSSVGSLALCLGGSRLTPEQQVVASCAAEVGLHPYAFIVCVGTEDTINELDKCFSLGVGGRGCFGPNNTLVRFVSDAWRGVAGGPNSVLNRPQQVFGGPNSVFNRPAQLAGGPNSVINNPGQLTGGPNSVINNPGQLTGGPNSVINNPGQITGGPNSVVNRVLRGKFW
jgi:hypothetical protein